ncbi:MAG: SRPBCC family protein [Bauldia sp.]|nr:SRPBCC family protein [Bauldia sp.]
MNAPGKLTVTLPSDREVLITRWFAAPRDLVFDCWTKPELIRRWLLGPEGWTMTVCTVDLRVGGRYRYEWRSTEGSVMGMGGEYREIVRPERLGSVELFDEDWTGGEATSTIVLTEEGGGTLLRQTSRYASKEARDGALRTGMTEGMEYGFGRLDALLAERAAAR